MFVFVAIAALVISGSYADSDDLNPFNVCKLMVDGTSIRDMDSCEYYYKCENGVARHLACPNGQQFNKDEERCTNPSQSTCGLVPDDISKICKNVAKGKWVADPYSCDGFYYCSGGDAGQKGECPEGLAFNQDKQECVAKDANCSKGTGNVDSKDAICSIVPNGKYFGVASSCSSWAVCKNGNYDEGLCDANKKTKFNTKNGNCEYESSCSQTGATGPVDPGSPSDDPPAFGGNCTEVDSYKTDGTCVGFYWCSYVKKWTRGVCSDYKAYDAVNNKCVDRSKVKCEKNPCQNTEGSLYKWVNDAQNCKNFITCKNNEQIGSGECQPSGALFDVIKQRCVKELSKNYAACPVKPVDPGTGGDSSETGPGTGGDSSETGPGTGGDSSETGPGTGVDSSETGPGTGVDSSETGPGTGVDSSETGTGTGVDSSETGTETEVDSKETGVDKIKKL
ncbi:hypothetical protein ACFFRR_010365 [Megaselia abdita]